MIRAILITLSIMSSSAFAGARLSVQANDYGDRMGYMAGLSVYQPLMWDLAIDSWLGLGIRPLVNGSDRQWASGKLAIQYSFSRLALSAGVFANTNSVDESISLDTDKSESGVFAKVSYKLW